MRTIFGLALLGLFSLSSQTLLASAKDVSLVCRGLHKSESYSSRPPKTESSNDQVVFKVQFREQESEKTKFLLNKFNVWVRGLPTKTLLVRYPLVCSGFENSILCTEDRADTNYSPIERKPGQSETVFRELQTKEQLELQIDRRAGVLTLDSVTQISLTNPNEQAKWSSRGTFECERLGERKF
jgi:hypothetical protein